MARIAVSVCTFEMTEEYGSPPSRAKDQSCREDVAISLITAEMNTITTIAVIAIVPG